MIIIDKSRRNSKIEIKKYWPTSLENHKPEPDETKNKVLYLKSLCYFYKNEYPLSLELINKILDEEPANMKASYLKNLINKKFGVIEWFI